MLLNEVRQAIYETLRDDTETTPIVPLAEEKHSLRYLLRLAEDAEEIDIAARIFPSHSEEPPPRAHILFARTSLGRGSCDRILEYAISFYILTTDSSFEQNDLIEERIINIFENKLFEVGGERVCFKFESSSDPAAYGIGFYANLVLFSFDTVNEFRTKNY